MFRSAEALVSAIRGGGDHPPRDLLFARGDYSEHAERVAFDNNHLRGSDNTRRHISTKISLKTI